jgi:hypothetical protein
VIQRRFRVAFDLYKDAVPHMHEHAAAAMTGATYALEHGRGWIRAADLPLLDRHGSSGRRISALKLKSF